MNMGSLVSIHQKPLKNLYPSIRSRNANGVSNVGGVSAAPTSFASPAAFSQQPQANGNSYNPYSMDSAPAKPAKAAVQNLLDLDAGDSDMPAPQQASQPKGSLYPPFEDPQPKQPQPVPSAPQTAAALVNQLSTLSIGADLSTHVACVAPKQLYLSASTAKGLEIQGTFARRRGNAYLDLTIANKALQPMTDFAVQFNKNT